MGERHTIETDVETIREAQELCIQWNEENDEGPLADRAEFEEE